MSFTITYIEPDGREYLADLLSGTIWFHGPSRSEECPELIFIFTEQFCSLKYLCAVQRTYNIIIALLYLVVTITNLIDAMSRSSGFDRLLQESTSSFPSLIMIDDAKYAFVRAYINCASITLSLPATDLHMRWSSVEWQKIILHNKNIWGMSWQKSQIMVKLQLL